MTTGGIRSGSGRPRQHPVAERYPQLDVRKLAKNGCLAEGYSGFSAWSNAPYFSGEVSVEVCRDSVVVAFTGGFTIQRTSLQLLRTECGFGGDRAWFACPQCSRRVAILYVYNVRLGCRTCNGMSYSSQRLGKLARANREYFKAVARLGKEGVRPQRMRWQTYIRAQKRVLDCQDRRVSALAAML